LTETVERTANSAILYDRSIINQISADRFSPAGWLHAEPVGGALGSGGRGTTLYVGNVPKQFVLRHYRRGGLPGKLIRDVYVWTGEDDTRPFREWRMLAKMSGFGLRVPRPAAARYVRHGPFYTADILTLRIPGVRPLSQVIAEKARDEAYWGSVGADLFEFHAAGVYHADMNAYNVQLDARERVWLLDFDKGRLREPGLWQQQTLKRLHRSLRKLRRLNPNLYFGQAEWDALLAGYFSASRSA
jgi:3-deoxy-D-manno-octulosonic acid kinase